jgi:glucose-6-phosphate 1-dehydrogenase
MAAADTFVVFGITGDLAKVMTFHSLAQRGGEGATPYEVLLHAAMEGDSVRFTRQDSVEAAWSVRQPLLDAPPEVQPYAQASWGPEAAKRLVAGHGGWHEPWVGA